MSMIDAIRGIPLVNDIKTAAAGLASHAMTMAVRLAGEVPAMSTLALWVFALVGIYMMGSALVKMGMAANRNALHQAGHDAAPGITALKILVGAALLSLPQAISTVSASLFGGNAADALGGTISVGGVTLGPEGAVAVNAVMVLVGFIGLIFFGKGVMMIPRVGGNAGGQPVSPWAVTWHIIGGALCINIGKSVALLQAMTGLNILSAA